jgi:glutamate formiminotransferase/formiminotetrahydrofolate cyclodeaminase
MGLPGLGERATTSVRIVGVSGIIKSFSVTVLRSVEMAKLVECVPNFSEGRDKSVIDAIARAVEGVSGVTLLDVDPGADTNRTVFTFVGRPEVIVDAAYAAIAKGVELIDMSQHRGAHARQGACDVCPFIPIGETTMEECVALARELGRRVGEGLGVPV